MESANDKAHIAVVPLGREYGSSEFRLLSELESQITGEADGAPVGLLIDLGDTLYIGCGLLSVLLRCSARIRESKRRFALCSLNSLPENVLVITGLDSVWEIFPTRAEATETMRRPLHDADAVEGPRLLKSGDAIQRDS